MAYKDDDPCRDNSKDHEPIFTLVARDESAGFVVLDWIKQNFCNYRCPDHKLRDAFDVAIAMRNWPDKKLAD